MQDQAFQTSHTEVFDFGFHDVFINDGNFEQFMDLIRGENADPIDKYNPNCDGDQLLFSTVGTVDNYQFCNSNPGNMFEINSAGNSNIPYSVLDSLPPFGREIDQGGDDENEGDDSSATTTTTLTKGTSINGRSRTLISERRRRGRMKEKLYALRSLVPNITKMDKASIIGDAVSYLHELLMQVKKLKSEIAGLESSQQLVGRFKGLVENLKKTQAASNNYPIHREIIQMDAFQVEETQFYMRLVCNREEGVAVALYKALESLLSLAIKSSNFTTVSERSILTFTADVQECGEEMNLPTLKLWVTRALLNQGFEFKTL